MAAGSLSIYLIPSSKNIFKFLFGWLFLPRPSFFFRHYYSAQRGKGALLKIRTVDEGSGKKENGSFNGTWIGRLHIFRARFISEQPSYNNCESKDLSTRKEDRMR
jgi:hypothetical protein